MMYSCQICGHQSSTSVAYLRHVKIHDNLPNLVLQCCMPNCTRTFKKYAGLKAHLYRKHKKYVTEPRLSIPVDLTCHVDFCTAKCDSLTKFYSHLKGHIKEGRTVACPFQQCDKSFTVISTLSCHLTRKHRESGQGNLIESITVSAGVSGTSGTCDDHDFLCDMQLDAAADDEQFEVCPENIDDSLFLRNLALFYLKLQAKLLLPASTIQTIIEDLQSIHDISQSQLLFKLNEKLHVLGISDEAMRTLIDDLKTEDLFRTHNTHTLKTDQRRKTVFKKQFNHVEPVPICMGQNEAGKERFVQYIPIKQTLEALFQCKSVSDQYNEVHTRAQTKDVFKDVWDGENITENPVQTESLHLILYQDAFEVVNPLGSGKKKHKVLAMYLTLADLLPHNRSSIDQMQLVLLCKEQDFKYFGQDVVMGQLVKDLKDLESNGVVLPDGQVRKGILHAIAGDNLGSHGIGGFLENFSKSVNFCRYCEIDRNTFQTDPLCRATTRTVQSYREHVQRLEDGSVQSGGIKFDSLFNKLSFFHVCKPGLPPCIGHDLFEGVVASDLALYIQHLVKVNKEFTYLELNRRINQFKYQGNDANDRPCEVSPGSDKLGGHAVQNWCLLRMLPVLIGEKIKSPGDNQTWQLVLQLREIVSLICAPAIPAGQIAYLRVLIDEYLHFRKQAFPSQH